MTAGRLAADKPGATTNTVLYKCPPTLSGSTVLNVCNQSGSGVTYRAALRDYDQVLHLDGLNTSAYKFAKGNPVTSYKVQLQPGFQYSEAIPGTEFTTTNNATAKILDVFKPTSDVVLYTIVKEISQTNLAADSLAGTFTGGETLTGSTSSFTALFRGIVGTTQTWLEYTDSAANATAVSISRNTGLADGMFINVGTAASADTEIITINAGGINTSTNQLTVTRGQLGTTAAAIKAGTAVNAWSESATTTTIDEGGTYVAGDGTLTVVDSAGFITGGIIKIDNELLAITDVAGNDLTVERGRYGTADVDHNNGVGVTLLTDNGVYLLNYFSEGETVTGAASNASAQLNYSVGSAAQINTKYLTTQTNGGTDHIFSQIQQIQIDRTYKWDLSDATCNNYPLKFSADDAEGTNGSGTEYTSGVSKVGTAGTGGAYTSIAVTGDTATSLFAYADGTPAGSTIQIGFQANTDTTPSYEEIYIYDVSGEPLVQGDTFTINQITQTVQASGVTPGAFGYVQSYDAAQCHLKVSLGIGSPAFAANDAFYDSPTLNNGTRTMTTVRTGKALTLNSIGGADASRSAGTYASISPNLTGGSGDLASTKVTVVVDGSGAATVTILDGGYGHAASNTLTVNDSQLGGGGGAALTFNVASISTGVNADVSEIYDDEDYVFYGKALAANVTDKNTSIIVGPGQNILVYSSAADISYVVNGFETQSDDFPVVNMTKVSSSAGGGGAA
tara:strand:- start:1011 stop:3206 length:2196 start_codon:yes stop_codon:yes gene_type:complete